MTIPAQMIVVMCKKKASVEHITLKSPKVAAVLLTANDMLVRAF